MNILYIFLLITAVAIAGYYYLQYKKNLKDELEFKAWEQSLLPTPPNANAKKMTMKEALTQSWKFLYNMADYVTKKFSSTDRSNTVAIGNKLINIGMHYHHVVDTSQVGANKHFRRTAAVDKNKDGAAQGR